MFKCMSMKYIEESEELLTLERRNKWSRDCWQQLKIDHFYWYLEHVLALRMLKWFRELVANRLHIDSYPLLMMMTMLLVSSLIHYILWIMIRVCKSMVNIPYEFPSTIWPRLSSDTLFLGAHVWICSFLCRISTSPYKQSSWKNYSLNYRKLFQTYSKRLR